MLPAPPILALFGIFFLRLAYMAKSPSGFKTTLTLIEEVLET